MATYTTAQSGNWSAGSTWVGGVMPPSGGGHKPVIAAGHQVVYDLAAGVYGDGTSSTTAASNAIVVLGTLRGHPSIPWSLTCAGSIVQGAGSSVIFDQSAGGSGTLILNSGGTVGQHGYVMLQGAANANVTIKGVNRKRASAIDAVTSGAVVRVADATGWVIGDAVEIASDIDDPIRSHYTTVTAVSAVSGTVCDVTLAAAINFPRAAGCVIVNLSSNMIVKAASAAAPSLCAFTATSTSGSVTLDISQARFENMCASSGWTGAAQTGVQYNGLCILSNSPQYINDCAIEWTHTLSNQTAAALMMVCGNSLDKGGFKGCVGRSSANSGNAYYFGNIAQADCANNIVTRTFNGIRSSNGVGAFDVLCVADKLWCSNALYVGDAGLVLMSGCESHALYALNSAAGELQYSGGSVSLTGRLQLQSSAAVAKSTFSGTTFNTTALTADNTTGSRPSQSARSILAFVNGVIADCRDTNYFREVVTDAAIRRRGTVSLKIKPRVANTAIKYTFAIPAITGVVQVIKGSLRFDAAYGATTPPSIALSGQGVTASYACAAVADAWDDFSLSFTPASTGDITVTVTAQSASTSGYAWLDGVYHYPMIQAVRHWGYQWLPQAAQLVDSRITLTEAAALALPVAVNHSLSTITITGAVTPSEALQAMLANLAQTANNARAVHVTGDGTTFVTTYTVILSGSGAVSGVYTDAGGLHVNISASAFLSGSRVQIYNVTDSVELYNAVLSTSGLVYPIIWTADKTIRVRVTKIGYLPLSLTGVLTGSGLTFLDAQEADSVYTTNGVNGSLVTGITDDNVNIQIDVASNTTVQNIYAWLRFHETSSGGISGPLFNSITAVDEVNYVVNTDVASVQLDNVSSGPILVTGGQITRKDGANIIAPTSNSIQIQPGKSYVSHADISATAIAVRDVPLAGSTLGTIITETGIRVISGP